MSTATLILGVLAIGAIVYVAGIERTQAAATKAGSGVKRAGRSSAVAGAAGAGLGLQFGDQLFSAIVTEPGFALAAVTGIFGTLGTGGYLGDITAIQFALAGVIAILVVYGIFGGDD